jgi:hypothetical protein
MEPRQLGDPTLAWCPPATPGTQTISVLRGSLEMGNVLGSARQSLGEVHLAIGGGCQVQDQLVVAVK